MERLGVEAALPGDHEVGAGQLVIEPREVQQQLDAGGVLRTQRQQCEAHPAGRPGAGALGQVGRAPRIGQEGGPPRQGRVGAGDRHRIGSLLRAVDGRGAGGTQQGVGDVRGQREAGGGQALAGRVKVELRGLLQSRDAGRDGATLPVQHAGTEGREQAGPAVGAGGPTHAHDELTAARVEGGRHQLSRAGAGGGQGTCRAVLGAAGLAGQGHARGGGELEEGGAAVGRAGPGGTVRVTPGAGDPRGARLPAGGEDGLDGAVTPIGDGDGADVRVRAGGEDALAQGGRDLAGGDRALEAVGRQDDAGPGG
ncbi:hypothetical protein BJF82_09325 [Kytococcus sp. CUA-901]|nr:hypothetical protein BJF82_09325 [Kytococcus sp. CUA-901]